MAKVQTIQGIFRKIGKKEAVEFIDGIVSLPEFFMVKNSVNANPKELERWLSDKVLNTYPGGISLVQIRQEGDERPTFLDIVISEFNEQYE